MVPNDGAAAQGSGVNGVTDGYIEMFLLKFVCPQVPTPAFAALPPAYWRALNAAMPACTAACLSFDNASLDKPYEHA